MRTLCGCTSTERISAKLLLFCAFNKILLDYERLITHCPCYTRLTIIFAKKKLVKEEMRHTPAFEYTECFMSHGRKCRRYFLRLRDNKSSNISPVLKYHRLKVRIEGTD